VSDEAFMAVLVRIAEALERLTAHGPDSDLCRIVAGLSDLNENIITATQEITRAMEQIR